jgi:hypothetical protein
METVTADSRSAVSASMSMDMPESMAGCESMASESGYTPDQHGKSKSPLCKMGVQCQIGCMTIPASVPSVARTAQAYRPVFFHASQTLFVREPDGLWKPPRSL